MPIAESEKPDLIAFGYHNLNSPVVKKVQSKMVATNKEDIKHAVNELRRNFLFTFAWNKLYRRDIIQQNELDYFGKIVEDNLFNERYIEYVNKMIVLPDVLYGYRQGRPGSLMQTADSILEKLTPAEQERAEAVHKQFNATFYDATIDLYFKIADEFAHKRNNIKRGNKEKRSKIKVSLKAISNMPKDLLVKYILIKNPSLIKIWIKKYE